MKTPSRKAVALETERLRLLDHIIYAARTCPDGVARLEIMLTVGQLCRVRSEIAELDDPVETWERIR
jgi:hypothetical protein